MFIRSWIHRLFAKPGFGTVSGPLRPSWDYLSALTAPQNLVVEPGSGSNWVLTWEPPASNGGSPIISYSVLVLVNGVPEASSGALGNVLTWTYGFPEFQNQEITVVVVASNAVVQSPRSNGVTFTPGAVTTTTTTTTTPDPGGRVTVLEDTFTGESPFNLHMPEVGAWNIGTDADLTGDGRLLFPQSLGGSLNTTDATGGAFEADFDFEFAEDFTTNMTIVFNEDGENDLSWKIVLTGNVVTLVEYASGVDTPRGSFNFPDGTIAAAITINTEAAGGDTVNVYVDGDLEITHNVTDRPGKAGTTITIYHDINAFNVYLTYAKVTQLP